MHIAPMTEEYAIEISNWNYADDYKIYNMPSWQEMFEDGWAIANSEKREREFRAFLSEDKELVAFTRHTLLADGIMLGVGVTPKYLSMGYGCEAIQLSVAFLLASYPAAEIFLDVRTWNKRAVRSYEKAGFTIQETIEQETHVGKGQFYRMYYKR